MGGVFKLYPSEAKTKFILVASLLGAQHFKNTERDDRRDFTLRVNESRKGEHAFWKDLYAEIEKAIHQVTNEQEKNHLRKERERILNKFPL